jgi:hypothetical protein
MRGVYHMGEAEDRAAREKAARDAEYAKEQEAFRRAQQEAADKAAREKAARDAEYQKELQKKPGT